MPGAECREVFGSYGHAEPVESADDVNFGIYLGVTATRDGAVDIRGWDEAVFEELVDPPIVDTESFFVRAGFRGKQNGSGLWLHASLDKA